MYCVRLRPTVSREAWSLMGTRRICERAGCYTPARFVAAITMIVLAAIPAACQRDAKLKDPRDSGGSRGQWVELIDSATTLGDSAVWIAVVPPVKTAFPFNLLCIGIPDGFRQNIIPLALIAPTGEHVVISAKVKLGDGSEVPMDFMELSAWRSATDGGYQYCLKSYLHSNKEGQGFPIGSLVTGLTLRSNVRITIRHLVWETHG